MHTLGYRFRPWVGDTALADGASILDYLRDTAREFGVDRHIRYGHEVVRAAWDTTTARWTVTAEVDGETRVITADFLWACSGYYDYDQGHAPHFEGQERFGGRGRPPAALARGPRLRRQAGGGDRLRRDRGDPGAGDGRGGRGPRHDAAALADLHPPGPRQGRGEAPADRAGGRADVVRRHPLEEHRAPVGALPAEPEPPRRRATDGPQGQRGDAAARLPGRHPLQADLRPVGPADVPGARRRPVPRDPPGPRRRGHRPHPHLHRDGPRARVRGAARRRRRGHRDGPQPADLRRRRARRRRRGRRAARTPWPTAR